MSAGVRAARGVIAGYRRWVSPLTPRHCRFEPTCSAYAVDALDRFGLWRGTLLAAARLARCHPWADGGLDPVPEKDRG